VYAALDFSGSAAAVSSGLEQLSPSAYANAAKLMLDGQRLYSDLILNTAAPEGDGLWHAFVQPFGGYTDQPGENGWEAGRGGIIAGLERAESGASVGAHVVFDHVSQNGDVNGHLHGEGLFLGLHGRWAPASWNGFHTYALGRAGFETMRMDRAFSFGPYRETADSDWTGTAGSLRVGGGWDADCGAFSFGPFAQLDYAFNARPSVDESGAAAALHLDSEVFQSLRSGIGVRIVSKGTPLASGLLLKAQASASWNHELLDKAGSFYASFRQARDASFSHDAEWEGRDSLGLSAGVSLDKGNGLSLSFHGGADLFRHSGSSVWGKASLNWKF
jgi:outer membrane autotransporter protein